MKVQLNMKNDLLVAFVLRTRHVKRSFFVNHGDHSFHIVVVGFLSGSKVFKLGFSEGFVRSATSTARTTSHRDTRSGCRRTMIIIPAPEFVCFRHIRIYLRKGENIDRNYKMDADSRKFSNYETPFTCMTVPDTDPKERPPKSESLTPFKATIGCVLASKSSLVLPHRVKLTLIMKAINVILISVLYKMNRYLSVGSVNQMYLTLPQFFIGCPRHDCSDIGCWFCNPNHIYLQKAVA